MKATDPCSVCGSKDLDLVDGYYYCVECGTQDTNVRETIVEHTILADGTFAQSTKRKIVKFNEQKVDMTPEWYKWHTFNFILFGLADELIALGAAPTFKTKLLWIWARYIKKHQKKEESGLNKEDDSKKTTQNATEAEKLSHEEYNEENVNKKKKRLKDNSEKPAKDLKIVTQGLLVTMLYVALNLDKSDIQISHIKRLIDEGRINVIDLSRHIPEGINVKAIGLDWQNFATSCNSINFFSIMRYRTVAMSLFRELDLGTPLLPDMRKIINNFITELCLPNEFKNLVFSLMHLWQCNLDIDSRGQNFVFKVPEYECVAMAYILVALKMCFGLDGDYEYKLSDVVARINEKELFPKSYKLGFTPEPTSKLFSFREWINYLQFRRIMLAKYLQLSVDETHYNDTDHYVFMEHLPERSKGKKLLTDELAMKIVDQIPQDEEIDVVPKDEFPFSLTPVTAYTEVITQYCKDPKVVQLLSEDFTQYSLKYACENLHLSDLEKSKNVVAGVTDYNKIVTRGEVMTYMKPLKKNKLRNWVYIRDCENKNWLKTNKPSIDHVTMESSEKEDKNDKDSDHGYDSNIENTPSDKDISGDGCDDDDVKVEKIREEVDGKNIFDDTFDDYNCKQESQVEDDNDFDMIQDQIDTYNGQHEQSDVEDDNSVSSDDSFEFNPETFNRERAIKELILQACRKYKIPIPKEYKTVEPRKRKYEHYDDENGQLRRKYARTKPGEAKMEIGKLLEAYYNHVEKDVVNKVAQQVRNVIRNMDITMEDIEVPDPAIEHCQSGVNSLIINDQTQRSEAGMSVREQNANDHNDTKAECENENIESTLFDEDSDVEANIDELIPKGDPRFDEKKYDVDQLYIKVDKVEPNYIYAAMQDPEINEIIEKKIEQNKRTRAKRPETRESAKTMEVSDSDDELPLNIIKEEKEMYLKELEVDENLEPLINNESIPEFKYWLRHYYSQYMGKVTNAREKFDTEIVQHTTETFNFVLRECAFVSGHSVFRLYRSLQILEENIIHWARKKTEM